MGRLRSTLSRSLEQRAKRRGNREARRVTCAQSSWRLHDRCCDARIRGTRHTRYQGEFKECEGILENATETYYVTDYYRRYLVILVRLSLLKREVLRELLAGSWRMTILEAPKKPHTANINAAALAA